MDPTSISMHQLDLVRRRLGLTMDLLGLGPRPAPSTLRLSRPLFDLRDYGGSGPRSLLIVPAPIKRGYIWDLAPTNSVVRRCLDAGLRVAMIAWRPPPASGPPTDLAAYVDAVEEAADTVGGAPPVLAGHSLGGTLAALLASVAPGRVQGLLLVDAPLCFEAGAVEAFTAGLPSARLAAEGTVAGSAIGLGGYLAAPEVFGGARWLDWWQSLADRRAMRLHLQVARWTLDEFPMPRPLLDDVIERLYRRNRFAHGGVMLGGRTATLAGLAVPTLVVAQEDSSLMPPRSTCPPELAPAELQVFWYRSETGVCLQHVGPLVGRRAHRELWPRITAWIAGR